MPKLTIDNQPIDVPAGTTILAAARQLGIDIPTMCTVEGLEPSSSCYVCVVQVNRSDRLLPSCATRVADGMVVETASPAVLAARKTAVELLLSDHLGECEAPCQVSCPAGLHVPRMTNQMMAGDFAAAAATASADLVLPAVLGRICPRFCEHTCRRRDRDQPVAIADLHRYAIERSIGVESDSGGPSVVRSAAGPQGCASAGGASSSETFNRDTQSPPQVATQGSASAGAKPVAIVGAGPAGLAAASKLLDFGRPVVLFDAAAEAGGMLRRGFDEARLPRVVIDAEIDAIRRRGAEFRMNTALGRDISLEQLRSEFAAVLLATGAPLWRKLECEGGELALPASDVIASLATPQPIDLECDVIIVGSGQEALETALTVRRHKATNIVVLSPRPQSHMSLLERSLKLAQASGVKFAFETQVVEVRRPAVRLYLVVKSKAHKAKLDCNLLINALGRDADAALLAGQGVQTSPRGVAVDDRNSLATAMPGVFAAGDAIGGGGYCVRAIAQGLAAAESIDQNLRGVAVVGPARPHVVRYGKLADEEKAMLLARSGSGSTRNQRIIEDATAQAEAARCLDCGCADNDKCRLRQAATTVGADSSRFKGERRAMERDASHPLVVYESGKCIMCNACVQICEGSAGFQPATGDRLETCPTLGLTCIARGFNVRVAVPWGGKVAEGLGELAARCAAACPTSAIVLKTASK